MSVSTVEPRYQDITKLMSQEDCTFSIRYLKFCIFNINIPLTLEEIEKQSLRFRKKILISQSIQRFLKIQYIPL